GAQGAMIERELTAGQARPVRAGIGRGPLLPVSKPVPAFVEGEIDGLIVRPLPIRRDARGWLVELFRHDDLDAALWPQMTYASMTLPGVTRGPHEHVDQTDGFAFFGPSDFLLWAWDTRADSPSHGRYCVLLVGESNPSAVWVPPGVVHAYKNV